MTQTPLSVDEIVSLSQGNPGAITTLSEIFNLAPEVMTKEFAEKATQKELVGTKLWVYYKGPARFNAQKVIDEILG